MGIAGITVPETTGLGSVFIAGAEGRGAAGAAFGGFDAAAVDLDEHLGHVEAEAEPCVPLRGRERLEQPRIALIADLHCTKTSQGAIKSPNR